MRDLGKEFNSNRLDLGLGSGRHGGIGGINLRDEMEAMLTEFGYPIILQRNNRKIHCRCWNHILSSATTSCPYCRGTGWVSSLERHIVYDNQMSAKEIMTTRAGPYQADTTTFYMRYTVEPSLGDVVYVVGWNGLQPTNIISRHDVIASTARRADHGRIEYWEVIGQINVIDTPIVSINLRRARDTVNNSTSHFTAHYDLLLGE